MVFINRCLQLHFNRRIQFNFFRSLYYNFLFHFRFLYYRFYHHFLFLNFRNFFIDRTIFYLSSNLGIKHFYLRPSKINLNVGFLRQKFLFFFQFFLDLFNLSLINLRPHIFLFLKQWWRRSNGNRLIIIRFHLLHLRMISLMSPSTSLIISNLI